ncbi:MAG: dockerin type I domain-containing protein [Pirellulaceae bacterium]
MRYRHSLFARTARIASQARHRRLFFERMEDRTMLDATPWTNMALPEDVDADGIVTATDAHIIVEMLNNNGGMPVPVPASGSGPPYPDVDGDWFVDEADWQRVCDALNQNSGGGIWNPPPGSPPPGNPPPGGPPSTPPATVTVSSIPASVDEMEVFTISGTFTMAYYLTVGSLGGEFRVIDGVFEGSESGPWSVTGYFTDDHGSGTASDVRTLQFKAGNLTEAEASADITVRNVNPSVQIASLGAYDEGSVATIDITMIDAANAYGIANDSYTIVIDWGDGVTQTIQTAQESQQSTQWNWTLIPPPPMNPPPFPPPFPSRLATHVYKDDNPTATPQDLYTVSAIIIDDDTGTGGGSGTVLIKNVKPVVQITSIEAVDHADYDGTILNPGQLDEGEGFKVKGTVSDVGILDTFTGKLRVDLNFDGDTDDDGEVKNLFFSQSDSGLWTFEGEVYNVWDDGPSGPGWASNITPSDPLYVTVEVWDDDMSTSEPGVTATTNTTIFNVPPVVKDADWTGVRNLDGSLLSITVSGTIDDLGAGDAHKVIVEYADGKTEQQFLLANQTSFSVTRAIPPGPPPTLFPIRVRVSDDDSGESFYTVYETGTPLPQVDIDVDSDNDGFIAEVDDPIEMDEPGALVRINDDDDNNNGIVDSSELHLGGNMDGDLELVLLSGPPANATLPKLQNWKYRLTIDAPTTDFRFWQENPSAPSGPMISIDASGAGYAWEAADPFLPDHIWLEALRPAGAIIEWAVQSKTTGGKKTDKVMVTAPRVTSVVFRTYGDNRAIDNASGVPNFPEPPVAPGLRIFPEAKTPDDTVGEAREVVEIFATVAPVRKNIPVIFTWWDVDDPSATTTPIDMTADGEFPVGLDNREGSRLYGVFLDKPAEDESVTKKTDAGSHATAYLSVSTRPGDNFRVTATNWIHTNSLLTQEIVDREGIGANVLPKDAKITELLTSWRTLHIEPDSMGDEGEEGPFDEAGAFTYRLDPQLDWDWFPENIGENGNTNAIFRAPSLTFLTEQMARCYIEVIADLQSYDATDQLSFTRNLTGGVQPSIDLINTVRDVPSRDNYWVIQVFAAYDGGVGEDLDTVGEAEYLAWTDHANPGDDELRVPVVLYLETLRDYLANSNHIAPPREELQSPQVYIGRIVLHEVVHRFGMPHGIGNAWDVGVLKVSNLFKSDAENALVPIQIHMIRTWRRP